MFASLAISGSLATASSDANLKGAFDAAFPERAVTAVIPAKPWGSNSSHEQPQQVRLTIDPDRLIALGGDRFALIVLETDVAGYRAEPGALGVAYLKRMPGRWAVEHVWRELAWTGNTGRPASFLKTAQYGGKLLIFFESDYLGQGEHEKTGYVVTLGRTSPVFNGNFPSGGSLGQDVCSVCFHYAYTSFIHPPNRSSDLFSVSYRGWTSSQSKVQRSYSFSARVEYRPSPRGLIASPPVKLPE